MEAMKLCRVLLAGCMVLCAVAVAPVAVAAEDAKLNAIWSALSDNDRAAMKAASLKVGATMQAIKGSPNADFWGELSGRGLMRSVSLVELFGAQAEAFQKAGLVAFAVTPKGAETIPGIVEELEKK